MDGYSVLLQDSVEGLGTQSKTFCAILCLMEPPTTFVPKILKAKIGIFMHIFCFFSSQIIFFFYHLKGLKLLYQFLWKPNKLPIKIALGALDWALCKRSSKTYSGSLINKKIKFNMKSVYLMYT